jgi:hypothetical protein
MSKQESKTDIGKETCCSGSLYLQQRSQPASQPARQDEEAGKQGEKAARQSWCRARAAAAHQQPPQGTNRTDAMLPVRHTYMRRFQLP